MTRKLQASVEDALLERSRAEAKRQGKSLDDLVGEALDFYLDQGDTVRLRKVERRRAIERWRGTLELPEPVDRFVEELRGDR